MKTILIFAAVAAATCASASYGLADEKDSKALPIDMQAQILEQLVNDRGLESKDGAIKLFAHAVKKRILIQPLRVHYDAKGQVSHITWTKEGELLVAEDRRKASIRMRNVFRVTPDGNNEAYFEDRVFVFEPVITGAAQEKIDAGKENRPRK